MRYRASKLELSGLFAETAVLSEHARPEDPALLDEGARDMARDIAATDAYVTSRRNGRSFETPPACCLRRHQSTDAATTSLGRNRLSSR
jgi:hypothetical protein